MRYVYTNSTATAIIQKYIYIYVMAKKQESMRENMNRKTTTKLLPARKNVWYWFSIFPSNVKLDVVVVVYAVVCCYYREPIKDNERSWFCIW